MSRNSWISLAAFFLLSLAAAWNGRRMRETMQQLDMQVALANEQRLEMGKLNAGFVSLEGRPRLEDSVVALGEKVAPWMAPSTPGLAGAAIGQTALRRAIWRPAGGSAEQGLEVFENVQTMASGSFDLALMLVFVLPLVLLFAPGPGMLLLGLGPLVSLIGIPLAGAPLASADSWLRIAVWVLLSGLYGRFWLLVRQRVSAYWVSAAVYVSLVLLVPALVTATAGLVVPPPSRVKLAQQTQEALRPVMEKTSRELAPFYESHPEYVEAGQTVAQYDLIRLRAEAEWRAAVAPLKQEAEDRAVLHRGALDMLAKLSPASTLYLALLETAGSGVSRQEDFEASAKAFGQKWAAGLQARMPHGHGLRPAELDQLPRFSYQEQSTVSWLTPAGIGLVVLGLWGIAVGFAKRSV